MVGETRQRLLEAAYDLFSCHGFNGVGLDRILRQVGVTKTTFYNHFESRDDLILAVIRWRDEVEFTRLTGRVRQQGGADPRRQLAAVFPVLDEWFREEPFRGCIFITAAADFPSACEPAHQASASHKQAVWRFLHDLAAAAGAADPGAVADEYSLLIEGAIIMRHVTGNPHAAAIAGQAAAVLLARQLHAPQPPGATARPAAPPQGADGAAPAPWPPPLPPHS